MNDIITCPGCGLLINSNSHHRCIGIEIITRDERDIGDGLDELDY